MNKAQEQLLELLKAYFNSQTPLISESEDISGALRLAEMHKLLPIARHAANSLPQISSLEGASANLLRQMSLNDVIYQTKKTAALKEILADFEKAGITALVVKGAAVAVCYNNPDYRVSSDEDIFIRREDLHRCADILQNSGFTDIDGIKTNKDVYLFKNDEKIIHLELHVSLLPSGTKNYKHLNELFAAAFNDSYTIDFDGTGIKTLPATEHLIFLVAHAFKHFVHSGFGIRQLCDVLVFTRKNSESIDFAQVDACLSALRADKFFGALLKIGSEYLGFSDLDSLKVKAPDGDCNDLLCDVFEAGIFGKSNENRMKSAAATDAAARAGRGKNTLSLFFPPLEIMRERYAVLHKYSFLLPLYWLVRSVEYLFGMRKSDSATSPFASADIAAKRLELLRHYDIID